MDASQEAGQIGELLIEQQAITEAAARAGAQGAEAHRPQARPRAHGSRHPERGRPASGARAPPAAAVRRSAADVAGPGVVRLLPETHARRFRAWCCRRTSAACWSAWRIPPTCSPMTNSPSASSSRCASPSSARASCCACSTSSTGAPTKSPPWCRKCATTCARPTSIWRNLTADEAAADAPVLRLLQSMFTDAVQVGASDIHIEPGDSQAARPPAHRRRPAGAAARRQPRGRRARDAPEAHVRSRHLGEAPAPGWPLSRSRSARRSSTCAWRPCRRNTAKAVVLRL
jgi:MSHA biogenesis protein MshE